MEENLNGSSAYGKRERKKTDKDGKLSVVTVTQIVVCILLCLSFLILSKTGMSEAFRSDMAALINWESFQSDAASVMGYVKNYLSEPVEFFPVFGSGKDETTIENTQESTSAQTTADEPQSETTEEPITDNGDKTDETELTEEDITEPETEKVSAQIKDVSVSTLSLDYKSQDETEKIVSPVDSKRYTSKFGYRINPITNVKAFHTGLDIAAPLGTKIKAAYNGTVSKTGEDSRSGKYIYLSHSNGLETLYCHCSSILAEKGAKIRQGETIALVGSTGWSTGPHLHFEIHKNGERIDPLPFLKEE
ncbi:MAG: peptidoglycan DD-metalloendopeptidase family protein [Acutalibacteraceae bacterium]